MEELGMEETGDRRNVFPIVRRMETGERPVECAPVFCPQFLSTHQDRGHSRRRARVGGLNERSSD